MRNTARKTSILLLAVLLAHSGFAQLLNKKKGGGLHMPESKVMLVKTGPYLGLESGKYTNFNFGIERQWQQVKLVRPHTNALNLQFDYNFKQKVMGAELGYWFKTGRLNLTYGARLSWETNYTEHRFGISPNVGYKLLQAHFQLGVHILTPADHFQNCNTFYASLRWVFINERKFAKK